MSRAGLTTSNSDNEAVTYAHFLWEQASPESFESRESFDRPSGASETTDQNSPVHSSVHNLPSIDTVQSNECLEEPNYTFHAHLDPDNANGSGGNAEDSPIDTRTDVTLESPTSNKFNKSSVISITVTNPQKVSESMGAFVTYLVTTIQEDKEQRVRRRFKEFEKLHSQLTAIFPALTIPPLPDHMRRQYIAGDCFSKEFTSKRAASLERFLFRISQHPDLRQSQCFKLFLAPREASFEEQLRALSISNPDSGILNQLSDSLLNAFSKVKNQSKEMTDCRERADRFEHTVKKIDKAVAHLNKSQQNLVRDYEDINAQSQRLAELEPPVREDFEKLAQMTQILRDAMAALHAKIDSQFAGGLRDMSQYAQAIKATLKQREQKQIDCEALTEYVVRLETEIAAARMGVNNSPKSYLLTKVNDLRGKNSAQARDEQIHKLEARLANLREEATKARELSEQYELVVKREVRIFEHTEILEFQSCLRKLADNQIDFYRRILTESRALGLVADQSQSQNHDQTQFTGFNEIRSSRDK